MGSLLAQRVVRRGFISTGQYSTVQYNRCAQVSLLTGPLGWLFTYRGVSEARLQLGDGRNAL